jgi:O-antigen/teichoic acid export membrane protein
MSPNLAQRVNIGVQAGAKILTLVLSLLAIRLIAEYLGVHQYGELAIVLSLVGLAPTVSG